MKIIILSGGTGSQMWPLSNESRSKQFLRLLKHPGSGKPESMIQRVVRQIKDTLPEADLLVATKEQQVDSISSHLSGNVDIIAEPSHRKTFPAVCLACEYLLKVKGCHDDETVVVMPCDQYTEPKYFETVGKMGSVVKNKSIQMAVMGILPDFPSSKFGYIIPDDVKGADADFLRVKKFYEKPDEKIARKLIAEGAYWNGGVFAFRLGFLKAFAEKYVVGDTFEEIVQHYDKYPAISFDYEVVEKVHDMVMVPFSGLWKDLDTWESLLREVDKEDVGAVVSAENTNTHVLNELQIPVVCVGTQNLIVAASPDGILIADKSNTDRIKDYSASFKTRPMFEERRWGTYHVIDRMKYPDGYETLTKRLTLNPDCSISYQRHQFRDETWTFIDGEGEIVINGERRTVRRGETVHIKKGELHTLRALTSLSFIEVQAGSNLVETDIERFPYDW